MHPELAALKDYWVSKCGDRRMPARSAIDPLEMKRWLGHLVLHEVIDGGRDFLCKVYGSVLVEMLHHDLTGRKLSDLPPDRVEIPRGELRKVVATGEPLYVVRRIVYPGNEFIEMERLALPLALDGREVNMILIGIYPAAAGSED